MNMAKLATSLKMIRKLNEIVTGMYHFQKSRQLDHLHVRGSLPSCQYDDMLRFMGKLTSSKSMEMKCIF